MRIKLRQRVDYPFFYTVDKIINVSQTHPEQTLDPRQLTDFHKKIIDQAVKDQILDVINDMATPAAKPDFTGAPFSVNQLRREIDLGHISIEEARVFKRQEESSSEPRVSIIKILNTYINTYA